MNTYSAERLAGREHIPLYPRGFIALRIVQLVLGVVIIGLCSLGVAGFAFSGDVLMLFTALATLITCIYLLVAEYGAPVLYNYWAILALDIFLVIFWLCSFALLAAKVSYFSIYRLDYSYYDRYYFSGATHAWVSCLATAAALGGVQFALFITSLAIHGVMLHRHRMAGLHCKHRLSRSPPVGEVGHSFRPEPNPDVPAYPSTGFPDLHNPEHELPAPTVGVQSGAEWNPKHPNPDHIQPFSYAPPAAALLPHKTVTPLSAQQTGDTFDQISPQELAPSMPTNTYEVSNNPPQHITSR